MYDIFEMETKKPKQETLYVGAASQWSVLGTKCFNPVQFLISIKHAFYNTKPEQKYPNHQSSINLLLVAPQQRQRQQDAVRLHS